MASVNTSPEMPERDLVMVPRVPRLRVPRLRVRRFRRFRRDRDRSTKVARDKPEVTLASVKVENHSMLYTLATGLSEEYKRLLHSAHAEEAVNRALEDDPEDFEALHMLGCIRCEKGDYDAAEKALVSACTHATEPRATESVRAHLYEDLAFTRQSKGDITGAEEAFRTALGIAESASHQVELWLELGLLLEDKGDVAGANTAYNAALEISPDHVGTWIALWRLLEEQKDIAGAERAYNRALSIEPASAVSWSNMGEQLEARGDIASAKRVYIQALQIDPSQVDTWCVLGELLWDNGDIEVAEWVYYHVLDIDPENENALASLSELEYGEKDTTEVVQDSSAAAASNAVGTKMGDSDDVGGMTADVYGLDKFVEYVGGPVSAARAIVCSWIDAGLLSGPYPVPREQPLSLYVLERERHALDAGVDGQHNGSKFVVCPTYMVNVVILAKDLAIKGIPDVRSGSGVTLKLLEEDLYFPPDMYDMPPDEHLNGGVIAHDAALTKAYAAIGDDEANTMFQEHATLLLMFITADAVGVYVGAVFPRLDVGPARHFPEEINGIRVRKFDGCIHPAYFEHADMKPAGPGAGISVGLMQGSTQGSLGAVVYDWEDNVVCITALHVVMSTEEFNTFKSECRLPDGLSRRRVVSDGGDDVGFPALRACKHDIVRLDNSECWDTSDMVGMAIPRQHGAIRRHSPNWYENGLPLSALAVSDDDLDNMTYADNLKLAKIGAATGFTKFKVFATRAWERKPVDKVYESFQGKNKWRCCSRCDIYQEDLQPSPFASGDSGALVWAENGSEAQPVGVFTNILNLKGTEMQLFVGTRATTVAKQLEIKWTVPPWVPIIAYARAYFAEHEGDDSVEVELCGGTGDDVKVVMDKLREQFTSVTHVSVTENGCVVEIKC
eukprot:m.207518 g.207518  ORF g.207518 m.207518 type:complete len:899 (+) comp23799_c0_seq1:238-2934(+)